MPKVVICTVGASLLTAWNTRWGKIQETSGYVVYEPRGAQYIKVEVLPGCESKALNLLGRKIYP